MMSKLKIMGTTLLVVGTLGGCGMMSKSDSDTPKVSLPEKIAVEIPDVLKIEKDQSTEVDQKDSDANKSIGFIELKEDIAYLEVQENRLKLDLLFVAPLMDEIVDRCKGVDLGSACYIPDDALHYIVTEAFKAQIDAIDPEESSYYRVGEELSFGDIDFIQYDENAPFRYALSLHDFSAEDSTSGIQWSLDQSHVYSSYREDEESRHNGITIDYYNDTNGERMAVVDRLEMLDYRDSFEFNLTHNNPDYYHLTSQAKVWEKEILSEAFASEGTLDANGGEMLFVGVYPEYRLREYERFDALGNALYDEWCTSDDEACLIEDEGTWWYEGDEQYTPEDTEEINARFDRLEERLAL